MEHALAEFEVTPPQFAARVRSAVKMDVDRLIGRGDMQRAFDEAEGVVGRTQGALTDEDVVVADWTARVG